MDYISNTDSQLIEMLQAMGLKSFDELVANIPDSIRSSSLELPAGLSESEVLSTCERLLSPNRSVNDFISFLGFGAYRHVIPTAVDALASRGEWLTPYTPYQAEASQGTLQLIYEFQTLVCELMQMEVANASLYDGASAIAEAALLALRATGRPRILISEAVHPQARQTVATYLQGASCIMQTIPTTNGVTDVEALSGAMRDDVAAIILQQPNVFGCVEPMEQAGAVAHRTGALFVASVYPISLGLLKPPGAYGADIAAAEGRCLGSPLSYGGPGLGLFATTQALLRRIPGRLAGCTVDQSGRRAFTLTLQTREQQIRREKATSNICTNEGWLCVRATIWLSLLGPQGLRELAELNVQHAHALAARLRQIPGIEPAFEQPFFNEFTLRLEPVRAETLATSLLNAGILGGVPLASWYPQLPGHSVWCATEQLTAGDIEKVVNVVRASC